MTNIGHNRPPRDEALTPAKKIERILTILDREGLTSAQKCVGVKIIAEADRDGAASVRTPELMRAASARDRETVFRATKALGDVGIEKTSGLGQAGRYVVLPDRVVAAVVEAYESKKSGRHEPDQLDDKSSGETRPVATSDPVGLNSTSTVEPVGMNPTGRHEPDQSRARVDSKLYNKNKKLPTTTVELEPARSGGGNFDQEFPGLNGTAVDLVGFIAKYALVDEDVARRMLKTNIQAYGIDALLDAYSVTLAEMATKAVATPYKFLMGCARNAKDKIARSGSKPKQSQYPKGPTVDDLDDVYAARRAAEGWVG